MEVIAPLTNEEVGGVAGHPDQCPLAKVCHGEALPWPSPQGHVGIRVPPGCILVVRKGLYGGVARVAPEVEGVAQVVWWSGGKSGSMRPSRTSCGCGG